MEQNENNVGDKLGIVTSYFNPCNYLSRFLNYNYFYESIKNYKNIDLIVIEQYSDNSIYRINNIHEQTYSFHSNEIYWMKEQLINKGLDILIEKNHENLCWLDCDIKFENKNWVDEILNVLKKEPMCHVFRNCLKKKPDSKVNKSYSFTVYAEKYNYELDFLLQRHGEPGFGFAYKTNFIKNAKLYQNAICGSGDFLNILGYSFETNHLEEELSTDRFFRNNSKSFLYDYIEWANLINQRHPTIRSANNSILVDYHGTIKNRNYVDREIILTRNRFNPSTDLEIQKDLYHIKNDKIKEQIANYFINRQEDKFIGNLNSNKYIKSKLLYIHRKRNELYSPNNDIHDDIKNLNTRQVETKHQLSLSHTPISPNCLIVSKIKDGLLKTNKCKYDKVIVDKSTKKQKNVIHSCESNEVVETYLNYIISNYENLSKKMIFASCDFYRNQDNIGSLFKTLDGFHLLDTPKAFKTDSDNHFLGRLEYNYKTRDYIRKFKQSQFDYTEWVQMILKRKVSTRRISTKNDNYHKHTFDETSVDYSSTNSFIVDKNTVLKNSKQFYINIYDNLQKQTWNEEMFYLLGSWQLIFK